MALCRRTLGSESHRYAIARPDKLGTDSMPYGGINESLDAAAETGRNPVSKHKIHPERGESAGRRGTGLPNLSRGTEFSGANGHREIFIFPLQLTTSRIGNLTRLIHTLLHVS